MVPRLLLLSALLVSPIALAQPADLSEWNRILAAYYDPAKGLDYEALKSRDAAALMALRARLARVDTDALTPADQLAHWINVYNINTVATIVESYPVESIRDISTDPIIRLNVFKKERVPVGNSLISLDEVEHEKIRKVFREPRIHFAINCAARSCPPIRPEAFTGAMLEAQLEDQTRKFINGPNGVRFGRRGDTLVIHTTKIMDWFRDDFEKQGGGTVAFIRRYVTPGLQREIDKAQKIVVEYDDYDWDLNDWKR
jgi:hypothetical protein